MRIKTYTPNVIFYYIILIISYAQSIKYIQKLNQSNSQENEYIIHRIVVSYYIYDRKEGSIRYVS